MPSLTPAAHDQPVGQDRLRQRFHVVGDNVVPAVGDRAGLAGAVQPQDGARAGAEHDLRMSSGRLDEIENVLDDRGINADLTRVGLERQDVAGAEYWGQAIHWLARAVLRQDGPLGVAPG